ncbi:MAG: DUF3365 domain-containing protein, partial [Proteobacteria bacterium]|nr:DUF3365 domain-containing protein [Pseudomonadota bacterium]
MTGIETENFVESQEEKSENKNTSPRIWISLVILALITSGSLSYTYYSSSYEKYLLRKSEEITTVIELVAAFVSTYSEHRTGQTGVSLPVPATFRAAALEIFDKKRTAGNKLTVQMVGLPGLAIKTEPSDEQMTTVVQSMSGGTESTIWTDFIGGPGHEVLRTIKPVKASKQSCVNCHNKLQAPKHVWKLGDTMGAYVLDAPAGAFFSALRWETGLLAVSIVVFILCGSAILKREQHRFSSVQARMQRESERGVMLTEAREMAQNEARSLSAQLLNTNQDLETALAKEKELNELQRQFISMASHEFRTPLSIIDSTAQRLKSRIDSGRFTPEDAHQRIEKIRATVRRMTRLMESTLTAARMQEGKIEVKIGPCDIGKVVREVCEYQKEISQSHVITYYLAGLP